MTESAVSEEVQEFLREHIESYEQLEILLFLRTQPDKSWNGNSIATELRMAPAFAEAALRFLCREGLVTMVSGANPRLFQYGPRPREWDELVGKLARAYDEHRLEIMKLMTTNAVERLRTSALRKFSDSFLIRRRNNKDG